MQELEYGVQQSMTETNVALWENWESGSTDVTAKVTRIFDGATDARYPDALTIDLDVIDEPHVIVKQNGTELRPVPSREQIDQAVAGAVFLATNYPEGAQPHILGRDVSKLRDAVVHAVMGALQ